MKARNHTINKAEKATTQTTGLMVVLYFVSESLDYVNNLLMFIAPRFHDAPHNAYLRPLSRYMSTIVKVGNPFVYVLRYDAFKKCIAQLICGNKPTTTQTVVSQSSRSNDRGAN